MTPQDDPPISPDEEARVRALLASVHTPPMPADVAARLQQTIRDEAQARTASSGPPGVTPLDAARSRRRLVPLLAAAAVTVGVLAVGLPVVLDGGGSQDGASSDSVESAPSDTGIAPEPSADGKPRNDAAAPSGRSPNLTTADFADDVRTQLTGGERQPEPLESRPAKLRCVDGSLMLAGAVEVTLDGSPAELISYGPDSARVFEALDCGPTGLPTSLTRTTLDLG